MKGRPPVDGEALRLRGSWRGKGRATYAPPAWNGRPPVGLDGRERAVWNRLTRVLKNAGVLTADNAWPLARYIVLYCEWDELRGDPGATSRRVVLSGALVKLEEQFGMTPATRARIRPLLAQTPVDEKAAKYFGTSGA